MKIELIMNTFGNKLRLTTFGESHGPAIGGVIDGFPSGFKIDFNEVFSEVASRSPGSSDLVTQRKETDHPEFLSGINEDGITLGTSIGFIIRNSDHHSNDYSDLANKYRPNHADYTYDARYGIRDFRGGGRSSARETANWVVAGAFAQQWLKARGITISTALTSVGNIDYTENIIKALSEHPNTYGKLEIPESYKILMEETIREAKKSGNSVGGIVTCLISNFPEGIGEPIFDKLHAKLAAAMMSINAVKGFEYGLGFISSKKYGSDILDIFNLKDEKIITSTNYSGGIQGGISNGMPIYFNVAFKPTPTIMKELPTVTQDHEEAVLKMRGRHDPCVAVRGVPVVKAMTALVLMDALL